MKEKIIFKKERDLGEVLNDTFKFLRLQGKDLFGYIIRFAGPALLLMVIGFVLYTQSITSTFGNPGLLGGVESFTINIAIAGIVLLISGVVYYSLLYGVINSYIKSYIKNEGVVIKEEITTGVRANFWSLVGLNLLVGLMIAAGTLFCVVPGIYLGVALIATYSILIMERKSVTDTISHAFELIKGEWFITFATVFVIGILYYIMIIIFQIPQYIYFFIKMFVHSDTLAAGDISGMFDWGYTILNAVAMIFQYLGYSLIAIATVFIYYNLNEKKNQTGTIESIEKLGSKNDDESLITY